MPDQNNFRTVLKPIPSETKIDFQSPILMLGSCFSEYIGNHLKENKFHVITNPFGVIFNPISLFNLLKLVLPKGKVDAAYLVENEGLWFHYDVHSQLHAISRQDLLSHIEGIIEEVHHFIQTTKFVFLTFGTAFVYRNNVLDKLVANCHKVPHNEFSKELLTVEQIIQGYSELLALFPASIQVVLTVSPVRHIKDTIALNSVSKSTLRLACHSLSNQYENVSYFPSYELLMDDLRDYRFYNNDMLHPNRTAIQYVWDFFSDVFFDNSVKQFLMRFDKIKKSMEHRPFHPHSKAYRLFLENLLKKLQAIQEVDVKDEMIDVEEKLRKLEI